MGQINLTVENPGPNELRKFGLVSGFILVVLFGLLLPWLLNYQWPIWPWASWIVLGLWAVVAPSSLFYLYKYWMQFGHVAGWINTRIILGIMFFLLIFPAGIIMRLFATDPLRRKLESDSGSYRIKSPPLEKQHVERPF